MQLKISNNPHSLGRTIQEKQNQLFTLVEISLKLIQVYVELNQNKILSVIVGLKRRCQNVTIAELKRLVIGTFCFVLYSFSLIDHFNYNFEIKEIICNRNENVNNE